MTIKLIALDLDGTTLNKSGRLSARTKSALEEAIRGGVHVDYCNRQNIQCGA